MGDVVLVFEYVVLALWGWTGVALCLLGAVEIAERVFQGRVTCSARRKVIIGAIILCAGAIASWRDYAIPEVSTPESLDLDPWASRSRDQFAKTREEQALKKRAETLRRELNAGRAP
jgi:hypothetical protein